MLGEPKHYQTVPDAAKRLNKEVSWINRMLKAGRIPGAKRFGPVWAIPTDAQIQPKEYKHSEEERAKYREYQRQWRARNKTKKQSVPKGFCESCENPLIESGLGRPLASPDSISKYNPERICEACKRANQTVS